jgi:hypothetical protein
VTAKLDPARAAIWEPGSPGYVRDVVLVERAVRAALPRRTRGYAPRWVAVADTLAMGSTTSALLCRRFGLNPDEHIRFDGKVKPSSAILSP